MTDGLFSYLTDEGKELADSIRAELRKEKARCNRYCGTWNTYDRDCEIYGNYHPSPANCPYFIAGELERRKKEKTKENDR